MHSFTKGKIWIFEVPEKFDTVVDELQNRIDEYTAEDVEMTGEMVSATEAVYQRQVT